MYFWDRLFYGNTLQTWVLTLLYALLIYVLLVAIRKIVGRQLTALDRRIHKEGYALALTLCAGTKQFFLILLAIYAASGNLTLSKGMTSLLDKIVVIGFFTQVALWGNQGISFYLDRYTRKNLTTDAAGVTTVTAMSYVGRIFLWALMLLIILDSLGFNVKTLIAGLGIGGIAVALAIQNILKDLLAAMSIAVDKPFVYGDYIDIGGNVAGTVEHIGLKTTKLRSQTGEQIILSNSDLLQSRIRNLQRIQERRVVFTIGVTYQTPSEKLEKIPALLRQIIERDQVRVERIHFTKLGDFALTFEVAYLLDNPDATFHLNTQHDINLKILKCFEGEGIVFAYPTQTILMGNG